MESTSFAFTAWRQAVVAIMSSPRRGDEDLEVSAENSSITRLSHGRGIGLQEPGQRVDLENVRAEGLRVDAELRESFEISRDEIRIARAGLQGERHQQTLRGDAFVLHRCTHFLEHDALMRGVLIHEQETVFAFHDHVEIVQHADDAEVAISSNPSISMKGTSEPGACSTTAGRSQAFPM